MTILFNGIIMLLKYLFVFIIMIGVLSIVDICIVPFFKYLFPLYHHNESTSNNSIGWIGLLEKED